MDAANSAQVEVIMLTAAHEETLAEVAATEADPGVAEAKRFGATAVAAQLTHALNALALSNSI
jgi:hypothetical protein